MDVEKNQLSDRWPRTQPETQPGTRPERASRTAFIALCGALLGLTGCDLNGTQSDSQDLLQDKTSIPCAGTQIPNQYIVKWKDGEITLENGESREDFVHEVLEPNRDRIEFAEPDRRIRLTPPREPIDQFEAFSSPSPAADWGQTIVGAPEAWAAGADGAGVTVAVIDSGADVLHPQLIGQLAPNPGEIGQDASGHDKASNGVDDDGNGLSDDSYGFDFYANAPLRGDANGHGTHVSGIVAADPDAGPIKGVAPKAKLLPLSFMSADGEGALSAAISAINYAAARGAKVINASWGGAYCSQAMRDTIASLRARGVLFVAAAGNNGDGYQSYGTDLAALPVFPAALGLPGQITVGASTSRDYMAGFSNYSYDLVDLVAPGSRILSSYPGGGSKMLDGTSMAAPFVSGAAALLLGYRPKATVDQLKQAILKGVDRGPFSVATQGRLNIRTSIEELARLVGPL